MTPELASALAKLPDKPGVYLMKDARGDVVYVGKAQSLRSRVRSYWQKQAPGGEIHRIRSVIDRVVMSRSPRPIRSRRRSCSKPT